ncbi:MAG TPA: hypothetical protein VIL41_07015 [Coriobacteriia bacterium]
MECIQAQQVISTALDREAVDAHQLEEAKAHCRTCAECGVFVRAQFVAQQVPLPEPPADLVDRVMAQVRAEATAAEAAACAIADANAAAAEREPSPLPPQIATLAPKPRRVRDLPRAWVAAAAAAAVIVALAGTGAVVVFGMRELNAGPTIKSTVSSNPESAQQAPSVSADLSGGAPAGAAQGATEAVAAQSITVSGTVYRLVGPATIDTATATRVGTTTTALSGNHSAQRDVWAASPSAETVYLADDSGAKFSFARVTRTYAGFTFVLTSAELTSYGQWPTLPAQMAPPSSADGQPTFTFDGTDASGTRVYRLTNASVGQGIAVAPKSPAGDPAGGNPNWTWWAIQR